MSKVIAVALPKGGVGKTTTAVNLAASFSVSGKRTLLVDLDPLGASALSLGFTEGAIKSGLLEIFNFVSSAQSAIHRTEMPLLDFIPSNVHSLQMEDRLTRLADNRTLLKNMLRGITCHYDYVVLDCPPMLRGLSTNALTAADTVLMPVKPGYFSLDAVDKLFKHLEHLREVANKHLQVEGILVTMHEPHARVSEITLRELTAKYSTYLFNTLIPNNSSLSEASFYGKPILLYKQNSRGAEAYRALAREIIDRDHRDHQTVPVRPALLEAISQEA